MNKRELRDFRLLSYKADFWVNLIRFRSEIEILTILEFLKEVIKGPFISDAEINYIAGETVAQAWYHLNITDSNRLKDAAFDVTVETILVMNDRVTFMRDVYMEVIKKEDSFKIKRITEAIISINMACAVVDSAIYGMFDCNIDHTNVDILIRMIYHFRNVGGLLTENSAELMTIFLIKDQQDGGIMEDAYCLELFQMSQKPLFIKL